MLPLCMEEGVGVIPWVAARARLPGGAGASGGDGGRGPPAPAPTPSPTISTAKPEDFYVIEGPSPPSPRRGGVPGPMQVAMALGCGAARQ